MGGGSWTTKDYRAYASACNLKYDDTTNRLSNTIRIEDVYKRKSIRADLSPNGVIRECCDTEEHPNTKPVILALDVTGSMGTAALEIAQSLNPIMTTLYNRVKDVEFLIMAIGDMECDSAPLQVSQFESDVRIAKALNDIYFEGYGGGNSYESYSAAWWFGAFQTKLDCCNRGGKGVIITIGDEPLNDYLNYDQLKMFVGESIVSKHASPQAKRVQSKYLYRSVSDKYDVFHIAVDDRRTAYKTYKNEIDETFGKLLGENLRVSTVENLKETITDIIISCYEKNNDETPCESQNCETQITEISW